MSDSMRLWGAAAALTLTLLAGVLLLALSQQAIAGPGTGAPQCGNAQGTPQYAADVAFTISPQSGFTGDNFNVMLANAPANSFNFQPVEIFWDFFNPTSQGTLIGTGTIGIDETSFSSLEQVPTTEPGAHSVGICWLYVETWFYQFTEYYVLGNDSQCGVNAPIEEDTDSDIGLSPNVGASGDAFVAAIAGAPSGFTSQPIELLWEWDFDPPTVDGELVGQGAIPPHSGNGEANGNAPNGLASGIYTVTVCWYYPGDGNETWFYRNLPFEIQGGGPPCLTTQDLTQGLTADDLVNAIVGPGIAHSNVNYTGSQISAGAFFDDCPVTGFDAGVILGTGDIADVSGANLGDDVGTNTGTVGDSDLTALSGVATTNAAVLEFDFVPQSDTLTFQYVFASEEYNQYVHSTLYNDAFALWITDGGPSTTDPIPFNCATVGGQPLSINSVNGGNPFGTLPAENPSLYRNNDPDDPAATLPTEMNGLTVVLECVAPVTPGVTNHMKLAIADGTDPAYDSNIFIRSDSVVAATPTPSPSPTPSPTNSPTPSATARATATPTARATDSPSPTSSATLSPSPSPTESLAPTATTPPTVPPTAPPTPTTAPTQPPTEPPTPSPSPTLIPPVTLTPFPTNSPAPTVPPTPTPTPTPTAAPTASASPTSLGTSQPVVVVTPTRTPVRVVGGVSVTPAPSLSSTPTPSDTPKPSATVLSATQAPVETDAPAVDAPLGDGGDVRPGFAKSVPVFRDFSLEPEVLATNIGFAGLMLMLLLLSSEIFNQTVEENDAEIKRMMRKYARPLLAAGEGIGNLWSTFFSGRGIAGLLGPVVILLIAGTIYGFSEPGFGFNEKSLVMFLGVVLTIGILTYWYDGGQVLMAKRLGVQSVIRMFPVGIVIAIASVVLTRIEGFQPGLIYGFIAAAVVVGPSALDKEKEGQMVFWPAVSLVALAIVAWLLVSPFRDLASDNPDSVFAVLPETVAVGLFVGAIQGIFFQLIPMKFMDGHKVWSWNKFAWLALAATTAFLFWHILLNKERSSFDAISQAMPATAIALMAACFLLTLFVWAYFKAKATGGGSRGYTGP